MKIVIEVPDEFYNEMVNQNGMSVCEAETVVNAFYLGVPIPKGRKQALSDEVDDYIERINKYSDICDDCAYTIASAVRQIAEKYIIEADEEEAEE